jgi:hypothetical protein
VQTNIKKIFTRLGRPANPNHSIIIKLILARKLEIKMTGKN